MKEKTGLKRLTACFMAVILFLTSAPLASLAGIDLSAFEGFFGVRAEAEDEDYSVGDHIQYGNYPQSKVTDKSTLALLEKKEKKWKSYRYYSGSGYMSDGKMEPSDYMFYADIDVDGDGLRDYRAVRIDKYRPWYTGKPSSSSYSYQDDNGYTTGSVYYFKFEPISWRILDLDEGLIMTEKIMDSQAYNNYVLESGTAPEGGYYAYWGDKDKTHYASDYYNSSIRQWLNKDFYNTAFTSSQANNIRKDVTLNNDCYSSSYPWYNSQASKDKIFLLSYEEARTSSYGFSSSSSTSDPARRAQGTDYAKSQGLYTNSSSYIGNSMWWLRSSDSTSISACQVCYDGSSSAYLGVSVTGDGVRPACRLSNLRSDIFKTPMDNNIGSGAEGGSSDNSNYTTGYITGDSNTSKIKITPRMKNTAVNGSVANIESLKGEVYAVVKGANAVSNGKTFSLSKNSFDIEYGDGKEGITVSADKYNDYIIPKTVAKSFIYKNNTKGNYKETIYMTRDKQDGKPYVSSVYARRQGYEEAYTNLVDSGSAYSVKRDETYDIIVTARNIKENATYYISQDNYPNHTLSNSTGVFSSASFKNFDKSKTIYAWVIAKNGGSEQIALKTKIIDVEDNALYKSLKKGKYSFGGEDGIKVTFPEDWVLIGGTSLDMSAFKLPAQCTYDPAQGTLRVAVSPIAYDSDADLTKDEETWNFFKGQTKGFSKEAQNWKKGMVSFKTQQMLRERGYPEEKIREITDSVEKKKFAVDAKAIIAIEFTLQNGEFVLKEGYGAIETKIKASMDGQYSAVVYGISGGADGSFGLTASRQVCSNDAPLSWNLKLSLTPNLKVYAGVGIQHVASASAYGILKLPFNWSFTQRHIDIALSGEVGLEAKVFIWKKNVPLLSGTLGPANFYYGKETKKLHSRAQIFSDKKYDVLPTYDVQSRDYAENTSGWLGEAKAPTNKPNKVKASSTTANGVAFKNLQTSVYDNSNAKVITCGGKTIATWIEDDANRDEYNRTRLVYSVYDASNDTWSAPKAVCDDGFVDANPYLATDGTDIYVAWQKLCKTFNAENSLTDKDILSAGEIYLAKYDKAADGFVDSVRLTNDSVYDYNPVVTIKNGNPIVYYCTSADSSMSESSGNKITKYANGKTATVKNNLSTVYAIDVCGDEIAYAVDIDGDVETTDDIGTFYGETTFSKFESGAEKSEMNFAFGKLDGKDTLFVSDGSNIYYNDNGEVKAVLEENTTITGQINAVNVGDGLSIFWTQENEVGNEIFTCSYANGKWSGATQSTSRNNKFTNISIATTSNGKVIGMCNETERKLDETENYYVDGVSNLVTFTANDYSDMTLLYAGLDESELVPGQTAKIYATVENNGNIEAESFSIKVADKYGTDAVTKITEPLDSGKKNTYEIDYLVPESFAGGDITLTVEADGDVDSKDNSFTYSVDTPNLVISNSSISNSGSLYTIDATVNNTNFTTARGLTFKAFFDSTDKEPFDSISIGDLSRDQYKNIQFSFAESDIIADENGSRFVYLVVEDENGNDAQLVVSLNEADAVCGHPITEERAEVSATCSEKGRTAGVFCTACETYVSGGEEIPALGHTEVTDKAIVATCTEEGKTEGKHCSVCGEVLVAQKDIPAKGHTEVKDKAVAATCTKKGKTAGSHCSVCGAVIKAQKTVSALGHKYKTTTKKATTSKSGKTVTACTVCGKVKKTTVIYKASSVKLSKTSYTYNGKAQKPKVVVKNSKGKALTEGKDYTVKYQSGRKSPGTYTVTVTFKGNYSGKKTLTFTIAPKAPTLKATAAKKSAKLSWNKQTGATGYNVYMAASKNGKYKKLANVKGNRNVKFTKTGLTKGKTYYFKVEAYTTSGKKTINGAYSAVKSVKVK